MATSKKGGSVERKLCLCGNLCHSQGRDALGRQRFSSRCTTCKRHGRRNKDIRCHRCGFIALDPVQLDVDHKDGNPSNNELSNLQTLCANCHRLKTKENNDWKNRS